MRQVLERGSGLSRKRGNMEKEGEDRVGRMHARTHTHDVNHKFIRNYDT